MLHDIKPNIDQSNAILEPSCMSADWWESFLFKTNSMQDTKVFSDAFSGREIENLKMLLFSTIRRIYQVKKNDYGFRCYLNGVEQNQKFVVKHLSEGNPCEDENLDEWMARVLENQGISIIFNHCEHFLDLIARQLSLYIKPLLEKIGMPVNGLHTTVFVGNYKYTPLGIHQDLPGGNVIHFHLGPGKKTMYTWEPELYNHLTGGKKNNHCIDPLLPYASRFDIEAGDIYSMPWSKYHVGSSNEISAAVTIWFDNHSNHVLVNKWMDYFKRNYFVLSDKDFLKPEKDINEFESAKKLSSSIKLEPWQEHLEFRQLFREIASEQLLILLSNGGWREHAPTLEQENKLTPMITNYLLNRVVKRIAPYEIYFQTKDEIHLLVFARGEKIILRMHSEFTNIIRRLNTENEIVVNDLLSQIENEDICNAAKYFISLLYNYQSIEFVKK